MIGLGTIINAAAILLGGILGLLFGKLLKTDMQKILVSACGLSVIFIGAEGCLTRLPLSENGGLIIILSLCIGGLLGELIGIERGTERFGEWLKRKFKSENDNGFVDGFVSTSVTVCVGAMAIIGPMNDALYGDISILVAKSILDCIILLVMTSSCGKGCIFSLIPCVAIQGFFTLFAKLIQPVLTEGALFCLSMVGSVLIFCVGINLVFGNKIKTANLLPAVVFAVIFGLVGL